MPSPRARHPAKPDRPSNATSPTWAYATNAADAQRSLGRPLGATRKSRAAGQTPTATASKTSEALASLRRRRHRRQALVDGAATRS